MRLQPVFQFVTLPRLRDEIGFAFLRVSVVGFGFVLRLWLCYAATSVVGFWLVVCAVVNRRQSLL